MGMSSHWPTVTSYPSSISLRFAVALDSGAGCTNEALLLVLFTLVFVVVVNYAGARHGNRPGTQI